MIEHFRRAIVRLLTPEDDVLRARAATHLAKFQQLHSSHVADMTPLHIRGALLKETARLICELADLPEHPNYRPKAGGPKPQKKPDVRGGMPEWIRDETVTPFKNGLH